jgi:hypothetical protein
VAVSCWLTAIGARQWISLAAQMAKAGRINREVARVRFSDPALADRWARYARARRRFIAWCALAVMTLIGLVTAFVVNTERGESEQFTLRLRPSAPLTMTACMAQAGRYGWPVSPERPSVCSLGIGRAWYHAVLTNHGAGAYPLCSATGFDSRRRIAFSGTLFFNFGGYPAGLYAGGHRSIVFSWYIPSHIPRPVARYAATCTVNEHPPI